MWKHLFIPRIIIQHPSHVFIRAVSRLVFISIIGAGLTYMISHEEESRNEPLVAGHVLLFSLNITCIFLLCVIGTSKETTQVVDVNIFPSLAEKFACAINKHDSLFVVITS
jgi:hypothetical protein